MKVTRPRDLVRVRSTVRYGEARYMIIHSEQIISSKGSIKHAPNSYKEFFGNSPRNYFEGHEESLDNLTSVHRDLEIKLAFNIVNARRSYALPHNNYIESTSNLRRQQGTCR